MVWEEQLEYFRSLEEKFCFFTGGFNFSVCNRTEDPISCIISSHWIVVCDLMLLYIQFFLFNLQDFCPFFSLQFIFLYMVKHLSLCYLICCYQPDMLLLVRHYGSLIEVRILMRTQGKIYIYLSLSFKFLLLQQAHEFETQTGSQAGWWKQLSTLIRRSSLNMSRDVGYYWLRIIIYIIVSFCVGTIYFDVGTSYTAILARGACGAFISGFMTFMSIGGFPSFIEEMKVTIPFLCQCNGG